MAKFEAQNLGIILTRQGKEREEYSCSVRKQEWTEGVNGLFCNEKRMKDVRLREEASEMRFTKIRSHERIVFFFDFTFWERDPRPWWWYRASWFSLKPFKKSSNKWRLKRPSQGMKKKKICGTALDLWTIRPRSSPFVLSPVELYKILNTHSRTTTPPVGYYIQQYSLSMINQRKKKSEWVR